MWGNAAVGFFLSDHIIPNSWQRWTSAVSLTLGEGAKDGVFPVLPPWETCRGPCFLPGHPGGSGCVAGWVENFPWAPGSAASLGSVPTLLSSPGPQTHGLCIHRSTGSGDRPWWVPACTARPGQLPQPRAVPTQWRNLGRPQGASLGALALLFYQPNHIPAAQLALGPGHVLFCGHGCGFAWRIELGPKVFVGDRWYFASVCPGMWMTKRSWRLCLTFSSSCLKEGGLRWRAVYLRRGECGHRPFVWKKGWKVVWKVPQRKTSILEEESRQAVRPLPTYFPGRRVMQLKAAETEFQSLSLGTDSLPSYRGEGAEDTKTDSDYVQLESRLSNAFYRELCFWEATSQVIHLGNLWGKKKFF